MLQYAHSESESESTRASLPCKLVATSVTSPDAGLMSMWPTWSLAGSLQVQKQTTLSDTGVLFALLQLQVSACLQECNIFKQTTAAVPLLENTRVQLANNTMHGVRRGGGGTFWE